MEDDCASGGAGRGAAVWPCGRQPGAAPQPGLLLATLLGILQELLLLLLLPLLLLLVPELLILPQFVAVIGCCKSKHCIISCGVEVVQGQASDHQGRACDHGLVAEDAEGPWCPGLRLPGQGPPGLPPVRGTGPGGGPGGG